MSATTTPVRTALPGEVWDRPVDEMRKGDRWLTGGGLAEQTLLLADPEPSTTSDLLRIRGRIVAATSPEDVGFEGTWAVTPDTRVDYVRPPA